MYESQCFLSILQIRKNMTALLKCSKFTLGGVNILKSAPQIILPLVPTTFKQKFARSFFHVLSAKYSYWSLMVSLRCSYSVWLKSTATGAYFKKYNFIFESSAVLFNYCKESLSTKNEITLQSCVGFIHASWTGSSQSLSVPFIETQVKQFSPTCSNRWRTPRFRAASIHKSI